MRLSGRGLKCVRGGRTIFAGLAVAVAAGEAPLALQGRHPLGVDAQQGGGGRGARALLEAGGRGGGGRGVEVGHAAGLHPVEHEAGERHVVRAQSLDEVRGLAECVALGRGDARSALPQANAAIVADSANAAGWRLMARAANANARFGTPEFTWTPPLSAVPRYTRDACDGWGSSPSRGSLR